MLTTYATKFLLIISIVSLISCGGGHSKVESPAASSSSSSLSLPLKAVEDNFSTIKNTAVTGNLANNDTGSDSTSIKYALAANSQPIYGTLILANNGTFTYTPNTNFIGDDNFQYQVSANNGDSSNASVKITVNSNGTEISWPSANSAIKSDPIIEADVAILLARMSLVEKIAQMTQAEIQSVSSNDIRQYHLGSVLNGGGSWPLNKKAASVSDWVNLAETFYNASIDTSQGGQGIPLIWGIDAVHGNNNVTGATLYPHNVGLGATHNPELIKAIGTATAKEVAVTGLDWVFAPTIAVVRDDRWGRAYESYSEDPEIVRAYAGKMIEGLQGTANTSDLFSSAHVIATAKHFLGDGGTNNGTNEGNNIATEQQLLDIHAQGYLAAIGAGAQTVMASYNSWQGNKIHGSEYLLTHVLKQQMGFDGFVISDWNGQGEVPGCSNSHCPQAINAGVDMVMVPYEWKSFIANTINDVQGGAIPLARINDAVTRILRVKMRAGLFTKGAPSLRSLANQLAQFGSVEHRTLARQAVSESLVLLKNKNNILPLNRKLNVLVTGDGANNIGKQSGGWSLTWQGAVNNNNDFLGATSIYQGIQAAVTEAGGTVNLSSDGNYTGATPDVALVVYGENPYAEGAGDLSQLEYQAGNKTDLTLLKTLHNKGVPVVSIFLSGRPLWVNKELNASNAFVAAWLPGTEGAGIADVIFKNSDGTTKNDFKGKLAHSWPIANNQNVLNRFDANYNPLFAFGFGLTYQDTDVLSDNLPEDNSGNVLSNNPNQKRVVAYLPDWSGSFSSWAKTIDFTQMTHLNLAFGNPQGSDHHISINASDSELSNLVNSAHQAGVKVLISVAGGADSDAFTTHYTSSSVDALVQQIDNFISVHSLDGVDVDVEAPDKMGENYRIFVQKLIAQLRPKGKLITAAVAQWMQYGMDDDTLKTFDFINVMSYSTFAQAQQDMDFYVKQKQIPSDKAVLGVAFFGDASGCATNYYLYKDILAGYPDAWQKDKVVNAGCNITYTGEATLKKDILLSKDYGGMMFWELSGDAAGERSLYKIIQKNIL